MPSLGLVFRLEPFVEKMTVKFAVGANITISPHSIEIATEALMNELVCNFGAMRVRDDLEEQLVLQGRSKIVHSRGPGVIVQNSPRSLP